MRLTVGSCLQQSRVKVVTRDNGEGMPQANLDKIYEPLYTAQKALGLGCLPLVKGIMEQHLGGIEIDSQVGTGTKVTLWLPIKNGN